MTRLLFCLPFSYSLRFLQASDCQPPLEEGDQVLYINDMATDGVTHMEVMKCVTLLAIDPCFTRVT